MFKGINREKALVFFEKHGFKNLISRFKKKQDDSTDKEISAAKSQKYHVIQTLKDLKSLENKIQKKKLVSVDTETNSLNANFANLVGISLSINIIYFN